MKQQGWRYLVASSIAVAAAALSFSTQAAAPSFTDAKALEGDRNFCVGQPDGTYEHPDCRMYYSCKKSLASQVACPSGQVYNPDKNPDDNPALSYCSAPDEMKHVDCSGISLVK